MKYVRHFLEDAHSLEAPGVSAVYGSAPMVVLAYPSPSLLGDRGLQFSAIDANAIRALGLASVNADALRADVEVLFALPTAWGGSSFSYVAGARCSGTATAPTGYFAEWDMGAFTLAIVKVVAGVRTVLATTSVSPITPNFLRFRVSGTDLKARFFSTYDDASEPAAWSLSTTDAAISAAGNACVGVRNMTGSIIYPTVDFNFVNYGTGGDIAPAAPKTWAEFLEFLDVQDTMRCALVEIDPLGQTSAGAAVPARVCMSNYPFVSAPEDVYPNQPYEEILKSVGDFTRSVDAAFRGRSTISRGDVEFLDEVATNDNGYIPTSTNTARLAEWQSWNWDGRPARVLYGHPAWRRCDFKTVQMCAVNDIGPAGRGRGSFRLRGKEDLMQQPLSTVLIGGSGANFPNANSISPIWSGSVFNVEPPYYDTNALSLQVFQATAAVFGTSLFNSFQYHEVRDAGLLLTKSTVISAVAGSTLTFSAAHGLVIGATWTSPSGAGALPAPLVAGAKYYVVAVPNAAAVQLSSTSGGAAIAYSTFTTGASGIGRLYDWDDQGTTGRITLLSTPAGRITFSSKQSTEANSYPARVRDVMTWCAYKTGYTISDLDNSSGYLIEIDATLSQRVGVWINQQRAGGDALDELMVSVGAFWYFSRTGLLRGKQFALPSGTPAWTLVEDDIKDFQPGRRLPPAEVERLGYQKNYTVMKDGIVGGVPVSERELLGREYTVATPYVPTETGLDQPANHILRRKPPERVTTISDAADAAAECQRQYLLFRKMCGTFTFMTDANAFAMELGETIKITHPLYGFAAGKNAVITRITDKLLEGKAEVEVFCQIDGQFPVASTANPFVSEDYYE